MSASAAELVAAGNRAESESRVREACDLYRRAIEADPAHAPGYLNLGAALEALGEPEGAADAYRALLGIDGENPHASYNLGRLRFAAGAAPEAEGRLRDALRARPGFPEARLMLAITLDAQGKLHDAAAELDAAEDFGGLFIQAGILRRLGRLDAAARALRRALALEPDNLDALALLSQVLDAQGDHEGAARSLEALLRQRPQWAEALYNYGTALNKLMRAREAEDAFRRAVQAEPRFVRAWRMLGGVLLGQGRVDEALALYRDAPRDAELESAELFALNACGGVNEEELFARHAGFGQRLETACPPRFVFSSEKKTARRLRIGYVSGDFAYHVVTLFMLPVLERHDRAAFEVVCYSTSPRVDDYTRKVASLAGAWRPAAGLSAEQLAEAIHADGIDILVDLAGHSGEPQLRVFAQRPAPVQATWLGYLNTTGLTRIDYRISDRHADPADVRHTEKLARLPHSQWCYRPFISTTAASSPPCAANGHVTFGSFNQMLKVSPASRLLWRRILDKVPGSRLVILGVPPGRAHDDLRRDLPQATLVPYVSLQDYYAWYDKVDIALDTTPYSGGTTTFDALWMGVPVLTAPGERPGSRSAASVLTSAGLGEWIASDADDYVARAVQFANKDVLSNLRATLRARLQASPLMDEAGFTKDLENLYRQMWRTYCTQRP
jgi:predicted O-linked N-acetylglucosamine transferase (SPINDLY family)